MQAIAKTKGRTLIRLNEKGQKLFMTLQTEGDLGKQTTRDENSHYVIATPDKSKAVRWELVTQADNTVMIVADIKGKKYHVCCHTFYPQDTRDVNSMFLLAHTDSNQPNTKWHVKEHKGGIAFSQAGTKFDLQNWTIGCHDFYKYSEVESGKMKRADQVCGGSNVLSCMVHRDSNMPRLSWKIMKAGEKIKGRGIENGMFKISLAEKGEKMFLSLQGNDEIGKMTNRDVNSQFVIAVNKKKLAKSWKVTKHPDNTYSFECELEGKNYHLCCHSFYPTDERDVNSKYVLAHTDSNQPNTKWQIQEVKPGVFAVIQAQNKFDLQGWRLGCHQFYQLKEVQDGKMKRADFLYEGKKNVLNCIVHRNSAEPRLLWKFHKQ